MSHVLIIGATSALGDAIATRFIESKRKVVLHCSDLEKADSRGLHMCRTGFPVLELDLANNAAIGEQFAYFLSHHQISVSDLIYCAGADYNRPVRSTSAASIDTLMRLNFYGFVEILNTLVKRSVNQGMLQRVTAISSISAVRGFKGKAAYAASKAALDAYIRVAARELAPRTVLNSVLPGAFPSNMTKEVFSDETARLAMQSDYPLGLGSAEAIADVVHNLHSTKYSWTTGQQIIVDGGLTI